MASQIGGCAIFAAMVLSAVGAPFPLGIIDSAGRTAVIQESSRVEQIDLQTGTIRHTWLVDARPLGVYRNQVLAIQSADALRLLFLDPASAQAVRQIDLTGTNPRDAGFSFRSEVSGNTLRLTWKQEGSYRGGAAVRPRIAQSYSISRSGAILIDLDSGKVSSIQETRNEAKPASPAEQDLFAYQLHYPTWTTAPWRFGSTTAWLTSAGEGETKTIFLATESERGRAKYRLVTAHHPFAFLALDGSAVLLLRDRPERAQLGAVFSVSGGAKIGDAPSAPGLREFSVDGSRIYSLNAAIAGSREQLTLHASDLNTGKELWRLDAGSLEPVRPARPQ